MMYDESPAIMKGTFMASTDIKAAFFDIDGTLTSFVTHVVPESTIEALRQLKARDVRVFICSGRAPSVMGVVLDTIPVEFDGIVGINGQYCVDGNGFLEKEPLAKEDIATVLDWLDGHPNVISNFCESDYVYFNHSNETLAATWRSLGKTAPKIYFDDPHERTLRYETFQISPYIDERTEAELVSLCPHIRGTRWHPDFVDLIAADGGKAKGIERFLRHYGWDREQTISFGDGGNDVDMLEYTGIGVAMGNATEAPKSVADYVTDDVDHDGIMNALKHFSIL